MSNSYTSESVQDTHKIARNLAVNLKGGEVIELIGDVGAGKTNFVVGLVKALGSTDHVSSPTFKICNTYKSDKLIIQHCDFYRLSGNDQLIKNELSEMIAPDTVVVLEWSENLGIDLGKTIKINISVAGENKRKFEVSGL